MLNQLWSRKSEFQFAAVSQEAGALSATELKIKSECPLRPCDIGGVWCEEDEELYCSFAASAFPCSRRGHRGGLLNLPGTDQATAAMFDLLGSKHKGQRL